MVDPKADTEELCGRCHWRQSVCLCHQAPLLTSCLHLLLLTHDREFAKPSNTGRLLEASLPHCQIQTWQRKTSGAALIESAKAKGQQPVLLFPIDDLASDSLNVLSERDVLSSPQGLENFWFILLDSTWQQARKMVRSSPELQSLPRLLLPAGLNSRYQLRKNQQSGNLSTVETAIVLLQSLGLEQSADELNHYFQRFLQHYEAQRSNHLCIS